MKPEKDSGERPGLLSTVLLGKPTSVGFAGLGSAYSTPTSSHSSLHLFHCDLPQKVPVLQAGQRRPQNIPGGKARTSSLLLSSQPRSKACSVLGNSRTQKIRCIKCLAGLGYCMYDRYRFRPPQIPVNMLFVTYNFFSLQQTFPFHNPRGSVDSNSNYGLGLWITSPANLSRKWGSFLFFMTQRPLATLASTAVKFRDNFL